MPDLSAMLSQLGEHTVEWLDASPHLTAAQAARPASLLALLEGCVKAIADLQDRIAHLEQRHPAA